MKEINNCKLYKLQNISTILAYNAIKYFYHVIRVKGNGQLGFGKIIYLLFMSNYNKNKY